MITNRFVVKSRELEQDLYDRRQIFRSDFGGNLKRDHVLFNQMIGIVLDFPYSEHFFATAEHGNRHREFGTVNSCEKTRLERTFRLRFIE